MAGKRLSEKERQDRADGVLAEVITIHYQTGEPVGSALLSQLKTLPFSSATIRAILGSLEGQGYLSQPHTSAGRLPTDRGYRRYVNHLKWQKNWPAPPNHQPDPTVSLPMEESRAETLARWLQKRTNLVGFTLPLPGEPRHEHVYLLPDATTPTVSWVLADGSQWRFAPRLGEQTPTILPALVTLLNRHFVHTPLDRIGHLAKANSGFQALLPSLETLLAQIIELSLNHRQRAFLPMRFFGLNRLLTYPEFKDQDRIGALLHLLEEAHALQQDLWQSLRHHPRQWLVKIGSEFSDPHCAPIAVMAWPLATSEHHITAIGVLGPKRLPYPHVFALFAQMEAMFSRPMPLM
jgi:heat-inducible transcriptional repressor